MRILQKNLFYNLGIVALIVIGFQITNGQANYNKCVNPISNWNKINITKKKAANYWLDHKFNAEERKLLSKALRLAIDRIQEKSIWQTVKNSYGFAHPKTKTLTDAKVCDNIDTRRNILFYQLSQMTRTTNIYGRKQFPKVQLHLRTVMAKKGKTEWVAYAYYNRVNISWDYANRRWKQRGSFSIYINRYYLQRPGIYKDVNYWAGTIAHEMLHNLGHQHPKSSDKNYHKYQINVLAKAIRNYGQSSESAAMSDTKYQPDTCSFQ